MVGMSGRLQGTKDMSCGRELVHTQSVRLRIHGAGWRACVPTRFPKTLHTCSRPLTLYSHPSQQKKNCARIKGRTPYFPPPQLRPAAPAGRRRRVALAATAAEIGA